ncbi:hypothetical protein B0H34DRAFT_802901 [Crassisporium funariophilum]|nr:hypothetical protein B0H34DRAFT_802901 [Crassisporium funariophilum]
MRLLQYRVSILLFGTLLHWTAHAIPLHLASPLQYNEKNLHEYHDAKRVEYAVSDGHALIGKMKHVVDNPSVPAHKALIKDAFGPHASTVLPTIQANVQQLHEGGIHVLAIHKKNMPGILAGVKHDHPQVGSYVMVGDSFHNVRKVDDKKRAGTMVHEATHALFKTKDNFSAVHGDHYKPLTPHEAKDTPSVSGYTMDSHAHDFNHLKANAHPSVLTHNADSYRKLAEACGALYPRILPQWGPFKRDLIRRCVKHAAVPRPPPHGSKIPIRASQASHPAHGASSNAHSPRPVAHGSKIPSPVTHHEPARHKR